MTVLAIVSSCLMAHPAHKAFPDLCNPISKQGYIVPPSLPEIRTPNNWPILTYKPFQQLHSLSADKPVNIHAMCRELMVSEIKISFMH